MVLSFCNSIGLKKKKRIKHKATDKAGHVCRYTQISEGLRNVPMDGFLMQVSPSLDVQHMALELGTGEHIPSMCQLQRLLFVPGSIKLALAANPSVSCFSEDTISFCD